MNRDRSSLRFDVDALFRHLINSLDHDPEEPMNWEFCFRADDYQLLLKVADSLSEEFEVVLQKGGTDILEDGRSYLGPPMVTVLIQGALEPDEVKRHAARFEQLAADLDLTYEGVSCSDPMGPEILEWLDLEGALWRHRHWIDVGEPEDSAEPWVFAIAAGDPVVLQSVASLLAETAPERVELTEEDDGEQILIARYAGRLDDRALEAKFSEIQRIARSAGAELLGVQFLEDAGSEKLLE